MMEPPGGCWVEIWVAAVWTVLKVPVRLVVRVEVQREGVMLWGLVSGP